MIPRASKIAALTALVLGVALAAPAAPQGARFDETLLKAFAARPLGPYRAGSWVTSIAVPSGPSREHLYTVYVGTRNGGIWKTANAGTTFEPVFDAQTRLSIGDVAVAPSAPNVVWAGTGEAYCARSSSAGDGVYKSVDAGATWTNMGLRDSAHVARIVIHPSDPDVVYVAAMGHLFSTNPERGVFRTSDGGRTWAKVLYIDERVGAADLAMDPSNPDVLYAAMYEKIRRPWEFIPGGPRSGIHKTLDGGKTWARLGGGLPTGQVGRIGVDVFRKNPAILYAVVENVNPRQPTAEEAEQDRRRGGAPRPRTMGNEVYRSDDAGATWRKVNAGYEAALDKAPYSFNMLRVDVDDPQTVYITGQSLASTADGGKTWQGLSWPSNGVFQRAFGDWRTMWLDPLDRDRLIFGSDGGVYISYDRGKTCRHWSNIPLGEFYAVGVDMQDPYNIYGGLQDHDSWKGPSNSWSGDVTLTDWVTVGGGDGMYNVADPTDPRWVYNNREFGTMWRFDQVEGVQTTITPRRSSGPGVERLRFNWTAPIVMSPHNPSIIYTAAQVVFRSLDRGDHWQEISPDLSTNDKAKQSGLGNVTFCTVTTLAESPVRAGVLWAGTDDGRVQVSTNGGASWTDRTAKLSAAGAPADWWVSRVFASPHDAGTAFAAKTGFRFDDDRPVLLKTVDFGETWTSIASNLPSDRSVHAVVQDGRNPDLLFAGTEHGAFVTADGGASWLQFRAGMPWAKVTDLVIHPRENDLVVATYGRGLFVVDVSPLREMTGAALEEDVHLFDVEPHTPRVGGPVGNYQLLGDSYLMTPNEPDAVTVAYYLKAKAAGPVKVVVSDASGQALQTLEGKGEPGINRVLWYMVAAKPGEEPRWWEPAARVGPGEYTVTIDVAGKKISKKAVIRKSRGWTIGPTPVIID